jgi:hypothetical protein
MAEPIEDAVSQWKPVIEDQNHPFGEITVGAQICAYCAANNMNAACPIRVETKRSPILRTQIYVGSQLALLAAGCWPDKFRIIDASGMLIDPRAITTIHGTAVCKWHIHDEMQKSRYARG